MCKSFIVEDSGSGSTKSFLFNASEEATSTEAYIELNGALHQGD